MSHRSGICKSDTCHNTDVRLFEHKVLRWQHKLLCLVLSFFSISDLYVLPPPCSVEVLKHVSISYWHFKYYSLSYPMGTRGSLPGGKAAGA
jgi:hypothetical protein